MPKIKIQEKSQISVFTILKKQMVPCKSTAEEVSFESSHHRISSTDLKARTTLHVFRIDSKSRKVRGDISWCFCLFLPQIVLKNNPEHLILNAKCSWNTKKKMSSEFLKEGQTIISF